MTASAQYQVANSDFEKWEIVSGSNEEPVNWNSFLTATGSLLSQIKYNQIEKSTDKHSGNYSAKIVDRAVKILGITVAKAQGNLTTGCINGGSMTADDSSGNFNYTNESTGQCMAFSGKPDAVTVWIKNYTNSGDKKGKIAIYLHEKGYYQDPYYDYTKNGKTIPTHTGLGSNQGTSAYAKLVASAELFPVSNTSWRQEKIDFVYNDENVRPYYILASFATNSVPGEGSGGDDYMYIDDVKMIYYSELKSAKYDGKTIAFNGTAATIDEYYDENKLEISSNGHGATVETSMRQNKQLLTVTIKGDNFSEDDTNFHTYTIQFKQYGFDLLSLAYNGTEIAGYEKDGEPLDVILDEEFDINKLTYTISDYANFSYDYDEETSDLSIFVTSKSGSSAEYDFKFYRRGDVNGDRQVTIADVTSLVNIILGKTTDYKEAVADVNGDGKVTIADVTALVNIILGKN